jgi:uncharacterized protein (AIM24 family)
MRVGITGRFRRADTAPGAAMSEFHVETLEGQRFVRIVIRDEAVRAEAGALSYMRGKIIVDAHIPGVGSAIRSMISDEPVIRPRYQGSGEIFLNSSFGGYHVFEVGDEAWILESGAYWASEDSVMLGLHRERMLTSWFAGDGLIDYQTKVAGRGKVVLNAQGPVEEIELGEESISVEGKVVIARTAGVGYRIRRPTRSLLGFWLSGEQFVRTYTGPGRVLLAWTPYWNERLYRAALGNELA